MARQLCRHSPIGVIIAELASAFGRTVVILAGVVGICGILNGLVGAVTAGQALDAQVDASLVTSAYTGIHVTTALVVSDILNTLVTLEVGITAREVADVGATNGTWAIVVEAGVESQVERVGCTILGG